MAGAIEGDTSMQNRRGRRFKEGDNCNGIGGTGGSRGTGRGRRADDITCWGRLPLVYIVSEAPYVVGGQVEVSIISSP